MHKLPPLFIQLELAVPSELCSVHSAATLWRSLSCIYSLEEFAVCLFSIKAPPDAGGLGAGELRGSTAQMGINLLFI